MGELSVGIEVITRGLRWEVVDIQPLGEQTLCRLRGLEGVVRGKEVDLLTPLEEVTPLEVNINPEKAGPLKNWLVYHQAYLLEQDLGSSALVSIQPGRLQIEPYQIVPLMRALKMTRPRLLLCDDVGLGKTIEAALIVTELMARRLVHRVLIVTPAGLLLDQWKTELLERFGIRADVIDRAFIEEVKRKSELGANPFDQIPLGLVSIDFLKQEKVLEQIERTTYDIIIIDEVHHCVDLGVNQDYDDSLRRNLAQVLATRCDVLLLLTATPHNGNDRSFASLLELLDMSLVDGKGVIRGEKYKPYVVRRLKKHIKDPVTGDPKFKERQVIPVSVVAQKEKHQAFIDFHKALLEFIAPELRAAFRARRYSDVLAFIVLLKRSVSTVYSCFETLKVIRDRFDQFIIETSENQERRKERIKALRDYHKKLAQFGTVSFEEEQDEQGLAAEDIAEQLATLQKQIRKGTRKIEWTENIQEGIENIISFAEKALNSDPKIEALVQQVKEIRAKEPKANILIYTEYTDSQKVIVEELINQKLGKVLVLSGGSPDAERKQITESFRNNDNMILVSTDAAAEGLNLHQKCHNLLHVELPFNPNRLEQRNGRIDRYGQTKDPIVRYLFLKDTFEDRILLRLIAKYERQRSKLTFVPNTLGISCATDASCERLLKGIMDDDTKLFKEEGAKFNFDNPEDDSLAEPAVKELLEEVDRSFKGFEKIAKDNIWIGESGVNAETELIQEAVEAHSEGQRLSNVDLLGFVCDAVLLDGGTVKEERGIFEITLSSEWVYGLDGLPGYDGTARVIRITTDIDVFQDKDENTVGFLGRSHPLVKRALDRVRNITFGNSLQDHRATAIRDDCDSPWALFTFLGSVVTKKTKLFEKVIAIKIDQKGIIEKFSSASEWSRFTNSERAINPKDIWKKFFQLWGEEAEGKVLKLAHEAFTPIFEKYIAAKKEELELERNRIDEWFALRVKEITGTSQEAVQYDLFDAQNKQETPSWSKFTDPVERISAFAKDKRNLRSKCSEAETLLRLYQSRVKDIEELLSFESTIVRPLGILMAIPKEKKHGV